MWTIRNDLQSLPKSFEDNPQAGLWTPCLKFNKAGHEYTSGKAENTENSQSSFIHDCDSLYQTFLETILQISSRTGKGKAPTSRRDNPCFLL